MTISSIATPWWEAKRLSEMSEAEWEMLCDRCAKCCLMKLEDEDTGDVYYTDVTCQLMDGSDGSCTQYGQRERLVPTCIKLTKNNLEQVEWMPLSCAYRRLMEGRGLASWHPLVTGNKDSTQQSGNSVLGRFVYETEVEDLEERIVTWPLNEGN
ncbi:MAG: YcgN family cysteine cluster protein [Thiotrichaceae bacterium]|nr:YcgN family cysteine cluster protein [Thiotrichaceae bacterium]